MEDKKSALLNAVKTAVARYGISGVSTRNIAEIAGVSDSHIYRFFENKEEMLLQAYIKENGEIFNALIRGVDYAHGVPLSFEEKAMISFDMIWESLLSDSERLSFCVFYYHSRFFSAASSYHNSQLAELADRLEGYFENREHCKHTMYAMCTLLYDSAYAVISGQVENTPEYKKHVFETEQAIFLSLANNKLFNR